MSLTISSRIIAEEIIQTITLQPVVGAYELMIPIRLEVYPEEKSRRWATITGARVTVKSAGGVAKTLGFARPQIPIQVRPLPHPQPISRDLMLPLHAQQVAALEDLRAGRDLEFELAVAGFGFDGTHDQQIYDRWRVQLPRSTWVERLRGAGVLDIHLLEIPMPVGESSEEWAEVGDHLLRAHKQFIDANYHECIALCRTVMEELGHKKYQKEGWANLILDRLANDRKNMKKEEREDAMLAVIRHYIHPAHHSSSEGGVYTYNRSEARLVLQLTAAHVAHVRSG